MAGTPEFKAARAAEMAAEAPLGGLVQQMTNYQKLVARAVGVFGDEIKASQWLSLPNSELNGDTPLQVAQRNRYDGHVLEPILIRIEHGIDV